MDLTNIEPRFRGLFEQIENRKLAFLNTQEDFSTFACTRWTNVLEGLFIDQLEKLSGTHDPEFIGQYVVEFFASLLDEVELDI